MRSAWPSAVLFLVLALPARATMVERMSLERLTGEAARIVHATVVDIRSGRDEAGLPATWITLAVARTLKGAATTELTVKQYGVGEQLDDGTLTRIAGLPRYRVGEEIVLFLRPDSRRGFTSPVGLAQGAYRIDRRGGRPVVRSDFAAGASQDLDAFLADVQRVRALLP